jgi:hypothetical protein
MKQIILTLVLVASFGILRAQEVLLSEVVEDSVKEQSFGANQQHYIHTYYGFGTAPMLDNGATAKQLSGTFRFEVGVRYKYKVSNHFAVGSDLYFATAAMYMDTDQPASLAFKSEYYSINSWGLSLYTRFNFGKRGNTLGTYLDLIGFGELNPGRYYSYTMETDASDNLIGHSSEKQVMYSKLDFLSKSTAGAGVRVGHKGISLVALYRLTDLLDVQAAPVGLGQGEFPPLTLMLEIGF